MTEKVLFDPLIGPKEVLPIEMKGYSKFPQRSRTWTSLSNAVSDSCHTQDTC